MCGAAFRFLAAGGSGRDENPPHEVAMGVRFTRFKHLVDATLASMRTPASEPQPVIAEPTHRRFLSLRPDDAAAFLRAAKSYVGNLDKPALDYLYNKPFDASPGNQMFYGELYPVMNMLRAMDIPAGGRVLEVGVGPGWITEILMGLGFEVDGIEPSGDLIRIAEQRTRGFAEHHHLSGAPTARFHQVTIEECDLPDDTFDAVFFHSALHHVLDETRTLLQCFRMLAPGGCLGVWEGAWYPGNRELEAEYENEMKKYGTLENPFTVAYLDMLLEKSGFVEITRYHSVNGLWPVAREGLTIRDVADPPAGAGNILTARKPTRLGPTTANFRAFTLAHIEVQDVKFDPASRDVAIRATLSNRGETAWLHRPRKAGWCSIALRQGQPGAPEFREAEPRNLLPETLIAGESLTLVLGFRLPEGHAAGGYWYVDLVNEGYYWFSARGTVAAPIVLPEP